MADKYHIFQLFSWLYTEMRVIIIVELFWRVECETMPQNNFGICLPYWVYDFPYVAVIEKVTNVERTLIKVTGDW